MKFNQLARSETLHGVAGLLRMDGAAVACFKGGFWRLVAGVAVVAALSVAVFISIAPIFPNLDVNTWDILRVAFTEACQYLIIINIVQVAAFKWGRFSQWSRCAVTMLWATALANFLTLIAILASRVANHFFLHDASARSLLLSIVSFGLFLYLLITMCRVLHDGLQVTWRQVAAVMVGSLFANMLIVQLAAAVNGDFNARSLLRHEAVQKR